MSKKLLSATDLALHFQVHPSRVRSWERAGKIRAEQKIPGKAKQYDLEKVLKMLQKPDDERYTIIYINKNLYSSEEMLEREIAFAKQFCISNGWKYRVVMDDLFTKEPFSGMRDLIETLLNAGADRVVINKESVFGFCGYRIIKEICNDQNVPLVAIEGQKDKYKDFIIDTIDTVKKLAQLGYEKNHEKYNALCHHLQGAIDELC